MPVGPPALPSPERYLTWEGALIRRISLLIVLLAVFAPLASAHADDLLTEPFETDNWWEGWVDYRHSDNGGFDDLRSRIVANGWRGNALQVTIPPFGRRGSGAHYLLPNGLEEAWFRYQLSLDDWNAGDSGKLPGFADVGAATARGCNKSTPSDPGWSARVLFNPPGTFEAPAGQIRLGYYVYHLDQPNICGEKMNWSTDAIVKQNRWYCIEGHVKMNTPGQNDGILEAFIDGTTVFSRSDLAFRRTDEGSRVQLNSMWLDVYFGGSQIPNYHELGLRLDQLVVRDNGRVGCGPRFSDHAGNVHRDDIEFLYKEGIVFGCAQNRYCPKDEITRAELLALIDRYLGPPATDQDFFTDDDGHWAENVINRLAAAGVVKGCTPTEVCPNQPVTRGQMAAFLRRTFELDVPEGTYFEDLGGSVFVDDINAIAATGITRGCAEGRYCPGDHTRRDQMASFFARAIRWAENDE